MSKISVFGWLFTISTFPLVSLGYFSGSPYFDNLRNDRNVPKHCRQTRLEHFSSDMKIFTVGIEGSKSVGFTFEYPIDRDDANLLWKAMKNQSVSSRLQRRLREDPSLERDFNFLRNNWRRYDIDFGSEGDVLELLSYLLMRKYYPPQKYFVTGGIEYHRSSEIQRVKRRDRGLGSRRHRGRNKVLGELDIVVGDRETCEVVALGEAKLGSHRLRKAHAQLDRFINFLKSHGRFFWF